MGRMILACIGLAVLSPTLLAAQTTPTVSPGDTIRIRTGPGTPWMVRTVLALQESELVVSDDTGALTVPFSAIAELEVHRPDPFDGQRALVGAGIGFGCGMLMIVSATTGDEGDMPAEVAAASAGLFTLYGAALGGGGNKALRGLLIGAAIAAVPGAIIGAASAEACEPDAWLCFGPEVYAMAGAVAGGAIGGLVGSWAGALTPGGWERVPPTRLAVSPGAQGGLTVSLLVSR